MSERKVSVVMPARNAERHIGAALRSLLREKVELDIVVVDDGSTDGTAAIVSGLAAEHGIVRLEPGPRAGVAAARNCGLAAVAPDSAWIAFLDADDLCPPGRIVRQQQRLVADPAAAFAIGMTRFFEDADEETCIVREGSRTTVVRLALLGASLFRREAVDATGTFDEALYCGEDVDFFLRLLEHSDRYVAEDEIAILYRRHDSNLTNDLAAMRRGMADVLRKSIQRRKERGGPMTIPPLFARPRPDARDWP